MADYDSSLPVRSEADIHERVQIKVVDSSTPSQQMEVDTDGNAHVEIHGNDPTATDKVVRLSEEGHVAIDGVYNASDNTDPSNFAIIGHSRNASPDDTHSTERLTSIEDSGGTVRALDISLHDESGEAFSVCNPLPVSVEASPSTGVLDYNTSTSVGTCVSVNHDYTVTACTTFSGEDIWVSGSGKIKATVSLQDACCACLYNVQFVGFNSTSNPNIHFPSGKISQSSGLNVRVTIMNRDNSPQDLYSTVTGFEA